MVLFAEKEKHPANPKEPSMRPAKREPSASAASQINTNPDLADLLEARIVGAAAVHVNGHQRTGAGPYGRRHGVGIDAETHRLDLDQLDSRAGQARGVGGRDEGEIRHQHLVARTDTGGHERQRDGGSAACHGDGVPRPDKGRDPLLQLAGQRTIIYVLPIEHVAKPVKLAAGKMRTEPGDWLIGMVTRLGHRPEWTPPIAAAAEFLIGYGELKSAIIYITDIC